MPSTLHCAFTAVALGLSLVAHAAPVNSPTPAQAASAARSMHPWQVPTPRLKTEAYFTNLKDGDRIETPFVLKFGLSGGWGLAPISKASTGKSGHHHLLVNRELPLNFKEALPFNDQYIHFGKGQMETVLNFAPGTYKLRMLLADQGHIPHFVYNKPITITVLKKHAQPLEATPPAVSLGLAGAEVQRPFRVQFHASGLNVGRVEQQIEGTGHFRLTVTSTATKATAQLDFPQGETETYLSPPAGAYRLTLEWVDSVTAKTGSVPAAAVDVTAR